jgi:hypothetical protein
LIPTSKENWFGRDLARLNSNDNEYMVNTKLADKEKEIQLLRERDLMNTDAISNLSDKMQKLMVKIQELEKRQIQ